MKKILATILLVALVTLAACTPVVQRRARTGADPGTAGSRTD